MITGVDVGKPGTDETVVTHCMILPDGSGVPTGSFPLPKDHWLHAEEGPGPQGSIVPTFTRLALIDSLKYALRTVTDRGRILDFDPDALLRAFMVSVYGRPSFPTPGCYSALRENPDSALTELVSKTHLEWRRTVLREEEVGLIKHMRGLSFEYTNYKMERRRRYTVPLSVEYADNIVNRTRHWILVAYDLAKKAIRNFRVDHMQHIMEMSHNGVKEAFEYGIPGEDDDSGDEEVEMLSTPER